MNQRIILLVASILGFLSVAIGAFGAHALKPLLESSGKTNTFELAIRYQFFHLLAMLVTGLLINTFPSKKLQYAGLFFFLGILFFSGSLYVLCFTGMGIMGIVTPIGGVFFLLGWAFLFYGISTKK